MNEIIYALPTGFSAFCATNLDDILILLLFFSQVHSEFKKRQIIAGQYLGFFALVIASLPGFLGGLLFPRPWIGLLGIIPFFIGLSRLLNGENEEPDEEEITTLAPPPLPVSFWGGLLSPQTYGVAAITFANGGDNISIYMPLFASSSWESLSIILGEFFLLVGVWCYTAYQLSRIKTFAETLTRYGNRLVPFVLMVLGILILIDSRTLENRGLTVLTLIISTGYFLTCQRHRLSYGLIPLFSLVKKDSPTV
jgi:cadmium resistance transport/sequestration family protein